MNKFGYQSKWMECLKRNEDELSYIVGDSLISEIKKPDSKLHQHGSVTHTLIALLIWSKRWISNSTFDPRANLDELLAS